MFASTSTSSYRTYTYIHKHIADTCSSRIGTVFYAVQQTSYGSCTTNPEPRTPKLQTRISRL